MRSASPEPLTVERTEVAAANFIDLRGDYGSTWSGVANVIDCTHRVVKPANEEPCGFAASTPQPEWDFGYPQQFPELHVKNFTIDCAGYFRDMGGTRYRVSYGIASNHINGLNNLNANVDYKYPDVSYWPDTLEVDGLNIVNWRESLGSEPHVFMPLYMVEGKPAEQARSGAWTLKNITYDDEPFAPTTFENPDELAQAIEAVALSGVSSVELEVGSKYVYKTYDGDLGKQIEDALPTHDVAIEYVGDQPRLLLRSYKISGDEYTVAFPYLVEHRGNKDVAYYSGRELINVQNSKLAETPRVENGTFYALQLDCPEYAGSRGESVEGKATVYHVQLVKTHVVCDHVWGESTYEWSEDHSACTARRVCALDASHVREEAVEATAVVTRPATCARLGETTYTARFSDATYKEQTAVVDDIAINPDAHDWGDWAMTRPATETQEGEEARVCGNDSDHVETHVLPKLTPAPSYYAAEGDGNTWKPSGGGLLFVFKRTVDGDQTFGRFLGIRVDGENVASTLYDAGAGSVRITLREDFLATLDAGDHELQALFDDGMTRCPTEDEVGASPLSVQGLVPLIAAVVADAVLQSSHRHGKDADLPA